MRSHSFTSHLWSSISQYLNKPHHHPTHGQSHEQLRTPPLSPSHTTSHTQTPEATFLTTAPSPHLSSMSPPNIRPCHCGKRLNSATSLIQHRKSHEEPPPYRCLHCSKGFTSTSSLIRHQATHNVKPVKTAPDTKTLPAYIHLCHCDKRFASAAALHQHQKASHHQQGPEQPSWSCHQCGKSFPSASSLEQHREKHKIEQKQKCRCECGKRFQTADRMAQHQRESKAHIEAVSIVRGLQEKEAATLSSEDAQVIPEIGSVQVCVSPFFFFFLPCKYFC